MQEHKYQQQLQHTHNSTDNNDNDNHDSNNNNNDSDNDDNNSIIDKFNEDGLGCLSGPSSTVRQLWRPRTTNGQGTRGLLNFCWR